MFRESVEKYPLAHHPDVKAVVNEFDQLTLSKLDEEVLDLATRSAVSKLLVARNAFELDQLTKARLDEMILYEAKEILFSYRYCEIAGRINTIRGMFLGSLMNRVGHAFPGNTEEGKVVGDVG